ncbi:zinc-ribbon domain-containing protein [Dactylosporangium salmoneum]|uniref:zinc-ribbon domain-containing protein n=1 Tax=Dactylosporangium salmoneum TaxID=53361 RepID=UPI0031DD7975
MAVEPFSGPDAHRLGRCLTCGVQAHYTLKYTVEKNGVGEKTCRACFWRSWAVRARARDGLGVRRRYATEEIVRRLDAAGWEFLGTLVEVTDEYEPVLGKCRSCGRIQAAQVGDFACSCSRNTRSRYPTEKPTGKVPFAASGSEALAWWDHDANDPSSLATATVGARRDAHWRCPTCGLRFAKKVYEMAERPVCPACAQRESEAWRAEYERLSVTPVAAVPGLLAAWADDADPHQVMVAGSFGSYKFRCPNGHRPRLDPHTYHSRGCPSCKAKVTRAEPQVLAEVLPEIASQWHPARNGKYAPGNVVWNSKRNVWWRSDCCGHEWQEAVVDRDKYQRLRCPACRTILGSLAWCDPGLAAEWSPANPITPWHVRPHGNTPFVPEWICSINSGHVWQMPLSSRTNGAECPECRPTGKSRVELDHHAAALEVFGAAQSGALLRDPAFIARKAWTADVLVNTAEERVVIEYDGAYWHRPAAKVLVDISKSRDLLAAGYCVVRLREDDLPALEIAHPRYREFRVYSAAPRPRESMEAIRGWLPNSKGTTSG